MNSQPEIEFLLHLSDFGIKLGLEKTVNLLEKFGNPHYKYKSILIAGTNGKGSVAKTLATVLGEAGYRVGLYTSPHLVDLKERITINGQKIEEKIFTGKIKELQAVLQEEPYHLNPTFFEAITVLAFSFFADSKIDILICEVGMGGRFDSTNVLPSFMEIITNIGLEHTQFLGKTYAEIANEKAGIIKKNSMVITSAQEPDAMRVISEKAKEKESALYVYRKDFRARRTGFSSDGQKFNFYGEKNFPGIRTPLLGSHQIENMSLVLQSLGLLEQCGFPVKREAVYQGMGKVVWPCRFQILRKHPFLIIDGAHNPDGMETLVKSLRSICPHEKVSFLAGILKDKDWQKMLHILQRHRNIGELVFTRPETERAMDPQVLAAAIGRKDIKTAVIPDYRKAYRYMLKHPGNWCVCGSLYLCGNVLPLATKSAGQAEKN
ncbi:MAG TPA: folylpolyglutamate synthase/dihydrofolate synthase family protein [bacterium]|nr:folylpolyglutamate synthase/dihydrofolate synthase family protein [bacterium]